MRKSGFMKKRTWKRCLVTVVATAMVVSGGTVFDGSKSVKAAAVKKKGYTLSKAAGTYQKTVKVKIKAKKGYKVYYTLNGTLSLKKMVKSGKSKVVTIKKTKTLSIYCVKKSKKVKATALKTNGVKAKTKKYRYVIKKVAASSTPQPSASSKPAEVTGTPQPANTPAATSSPSGSSSGTTSTVETGFTTTLSSVNVSSQVNQVIDLSSTNGTKISDSDTGYTYKKSKKNKLQIMAPGTYTITGNGETIDGLIIVDFGEKYDLDGDGTDDTSYETSSGATADGVSIILDNVTLTDTNADFDLNNASEMTSDDGLIKVKSSDYLTGVKITVKNNVTLKDTGVTGVDSDDATDTTYSSAVLSKKTPLEIDGTGTLTISSVNGNGIKSTSSLLISNVTIKAGSEEEPVGHNGITAKTELETENADITVYSVKDGLKTTYDSPDVTSTESPYEPLFKVRGGNLIIQTADGDGISASYTLNEGTASETSYGKAMLAPVSVNIKTKAADTSSDSADDTIHSNGNVTITGGTMNLSAADDGIHADGLLTIQNGNITVTKSYEGLEGNDIVITGGTMNVTATDDGLNAAGGSDSGSSLQDFFGGGNGWRRAGASDSDGSYKGIKVGSSLIITDGTITVDTTSTGSKSSTMDGGMMNTADMDHAITITGGSLTVFAEGDGLDSNGNLYIKGGTITVYGPSNGGNGSIDIGDGGDCVFEITGGTLWAFAGSSDMAVTPTTASPGYVVFTTDTIASGNTVVLQDDSGNDIASVTIRKAAAHVIYYGSSISAGSSYILSSGGSSLGTAVAAVASSGNNGMPGGDFGGMPGGFGGFGPGGR